MHYFLLLFIGIRLSLAQKDLTIRDEFLTFDDLAEPVALGPSFTSDLIDWDNPDAETFTQDIDTPDFNFLSSFDEDESNADLMLAGCPSTYRLEGRDEPLTCPTNELKIPHLPTFDDLTNEIISPIYPPEEQQPQNPPGVFAFDDPLAKNEHYCKPDRPLLLCCYCNPLMKYRLCQDCLPMYSALGCFAPHVIVCCRNFGVYRLVPWGQTNLQYTIWPEDDFDPLEPTGHLQGGTLAETCSRIKDQIDADEGDFGWLSEPEKDQ